MVPNRTNHRVIVGTRLDTYPDEWLSNMRHKVLRHIGK